VKRSKPPVN